MMHNNHLLVLNAIELLISEVIVTMKEDNCRVLEKPFIETKIICQK